MPRRLRQLTITAAFCASLAACGEHAPDTESVSVPPAPAPEYVVPRERSVSRKLTSGDVALGTLSGQIDSRAAWVKEHPKDLATRSELVGLLLARSQYTGSYEDLDTAGSQAESAVSLAGDLPEPLLLRARVAMASHRFLDALAALDSAEDRGATESNAERTSIDVALGRELERTRERRRAQAKRVPTFRTLSDWAISEAALGHFEEADALFVRALGSYRDVSPFPVAWVQFQRGVMWAEQANEPERARPLYGDAVALLPGYVTAQVHLAEIEWDHGHAEVALARLLPLVERTSDPEPAAVVAKWMLEKDRPQAARFITIVQRGYEDLLTRHRAAFADHGAEFYANAGADPARALELAMYNLQVRPTARAYLVAIRSALAAESPKLCEIVQAAQRLASRSRNLAVEIDAVLADKICSD